MKKTMFFTSLIILVLLTSTACSNMANIEAETPNTMVPSIMVDGEIYYSTGSDMPIEVDESVIKIAASIVSGSKLPSKDGEINFPIQGAKYAKINDSEEYVVVMIDEEWVKFEKRTNEITELKKLIAEKDEEINRLKTDILNKTAELKELEESLVMVRFSALSRLDDYKDTFDNLDKVYKINSKYEIKDNWYIINDDYFQVELLQYENADKVDFYYIRMESDQEPALLFSDTNSKDGWIFTSDNISEKINKHQKGTSGGFLFEPYFVIYAEVTFEGGNVIRTSKLPIYNK